MREVKIYKSLLLLYALVLNPIIIQRCAIICYLLVYGGALVYIFLNQNVIINLFKRIQIHYVSVLLGTILLLLCSFLVPLVYGTNDFSYINVILAIYRKVILFTFLIIVTEKTYKEQFTTHIFMYYFVVATVCYVIVTGIFMLLPPLKQLWISLIGIDEFTRNLLTGYGYGGRFGWSGFSGFRNTIDCTCSIIFLLYLYCDKKAQAVGFGRFVVLSFILFLGNMFYGRTGMIASFLCIMLGLLLYRKIGIQHLAGIIGGLIAVIGLIVILQSRVSVIHDWYIWATTPFKNLLTQGSFNNYSANRVLHEMIFMPEGKTLLFGDGRYTDSLTDSYYMHTDVGFMRQILFWGIVLTGACYCLVVWAITLFTKRNYILRIMFLLALIIFEIKGEVYYEIMPFAIVLGLWQWKQESVELTS